VSASLALPTGVAFDASGNLYIADTLNNRVRKVDPAGIISTVAGNGTYAFGGDGGPASAASLRRPRGVALNARGTLYIADSDNGVVRSVDTAGTISTVAGGSPNDGTNYPGDGRRATAVCCLSDL